MKSARQVAIETLERKVEEKKSFLAVARLREPEYKHHMKELKAMEISLKELKFPTMN